MLKRRLVLLVLVVLTVGMMLTGCGGDDQEAINLTYQTWTESSIIGHITKTMIEENTDYDVKTVELDSNVIVWQAFKNDQVDVWGGYTSSFFNLFEDDQTVLYETDEIYDYVSTKLKNDHNIVMLERMGFYNNYDLAVTAEVAEKYNLKTYSDLAAVSNELAIAADVNFRDREDCYPLLQDVYGMDFDEIFQMSVGAKFEAVKNGEADVISCYTTDAGINRLGLVLLQDDKHSMLHFDGVYIIREETLEAYPDLEPLLNKIKITNDEMSKMNSLVEDEKKPVGEVARQFLEEKGLL